MFKFRVLFEFMFCFIFIYVFINKWLGFRLWVLDNDRFGFV